MRCCATVDHQQPVDVDGCPMALIDSTTPILMLFMTLMACAVPATAACGGAGNAVDGDGCETLLGDVLVVPICITLMWAVVPIIGWSV